MTVYDPRCLCDGGAYEVKDYPFIVNPECSIHGAVARRPVPCVALGTLLNHVGPLAGLTQLRSDGRHEVACRFDANLLYGCTIYGRCILSDGHEGDCCEDREVWPGPGMLYTVVL